MSDLIHEEENYTVSILNNSIVHLKVKDFQELQREDILSMQKWVHSVTDKKNMVSLLQFGNGSGATREAREFASSPDGITVTIASAVLVKNLAQQLLVDYYIKFNKPRVPTSVFTNYDKAIQWINDFLKENT